MTSSIFVISVRDANNSFSQKTFFASESANLSSAKEAFRDFNPEAELLEASIEEIEISEEEAQEKYDIALFI